MKQRFSSLDVNVISSELHSTLTGLRVSNIYDLSSRIFLIKIAKPENRRQLIIESGFRCHLTEYARATVGEPSAFVKRLRKYLKTRRVTAVSQIGTDRIIDIVFSDGIYHLFLEFFAAGNIILTDADYNILALFRNVPAGGDQDEVKTGLTYNVTNKQNYGGIPSLSPERLKDVLEKAISSESEHDSNSKPKAVVKKSKKKVSDLRKALSHGFPEFPPILLEHGVAIKSFDSNIKLGEVLRDESLLLQVFAVLQEAETILQSLSTGFKHSGFIIAKESDKTAQSADGDTAPSDPSTETRLLYDDFQPFYPRQFQDKPGASIVEFDGYNKTADEFFSSIETQRVESRLAEHEETARRKLATARSDHENRVGALKEAQELHIRKAEAVTANTYRVQEAIDAVNNLIAQGMDWVEIARLIEMEQTRNNPLAKIIQLPLKLYENTITLILNEASYDIEPEDSAYASVSDEEESDDSSDKQAMGQSTTEAATQALIVDIDLGLTPWANANQYYDQKKNAALKEQRTIQSSERALKSQEKKVSEDLKKNLKQEKHVLRTARNPFWFEKYLFFISSEGYLVVGGRDAHQSEMLYRRYLKKGDIFVHANIEGATSMIVKNREGTPDAPIPPGTLSQAGTLSVATSTAWDSKALMPAWWVRADQVSKLNERGELVATGEFAINGEKNYLAPAQLILGFTVLFQISKESVTNHRKHHLLEPEFKEDAIADNVNPSMEKSSENEVETRDRSSDQGEKHVDTKADDFRSRGPESDNEDGEKTTQLNPQQSSSEQRSAIDVENKFNVSKSSGEDNDSSPFDIESHEATESARINGASSRHNLRAKDHLSSHEHRRLKNGVRNLDSTTSSNKNSPTNAPAQSIASSVTSTSKPSAPVRGKRGKSKKAATKYADQDEEDRELALRLLGATRTQYDKTAEAAAAKAQRELELEAQKQRRRAQHDRAAEAERKRQAEFKSQGANIEAVEDDEEILQAEKEAFSWLPALIGAPFPEDEVLDAIPMAAPWSAVSRYKYRAKLQPGTVKRGKAVKEILGGWIAEASSLNGANRSGASGRPKIKLDLSEEVPGRLLDRPTAERMRTKEAELLKGWREAEVMNTLPVGKVRIISGVSSAAGGGKGAGKGTGGGGKGSGGKNFSRNGGKGEKKG